MPQALRNRQLANALSSLRDSGVIPNVAAALERSSGATLEALRDTVVAEISAFSASGNPDVLPELAQHTAAHLAEIQRLCGGAMPGEFDFVRRHAQHRAEQKFPLEATLHAYRCGHKVIARWLRTAALESTQDRSDTDQVITSVADFAIEYTDTISTIATSEYVNRTRHVAEAEGDRRTELLGLLLEGYDESDARAASLLKRAGYLEQRQSFCVAAAQSVDPTEMENPARAQRLADAISQAVSRLPIRTLTGIRDDIVTAVFSDTRRVSGWTIPQSLLAERIRPLLSTIGPAALIGVSSDQPSTSHIPKALNEAKMALGFASVTERLVHFSELPIRRLLLHLGGDQVQSALPVWSQSFIEADEKARGALVDTLRAYADADMNLLRAAKQLNVHPNTIYARVQKIQDITGMNALSYHALSELLLAADCRPRY
jgi:hypothetical protein